MVLVADLVAERVAKSEGWMSASRQVPLLGQGDFGQQLRNVRPDEVRAEQLTVFGVGDDLREPGADQCYVGASRRYGVTA